MFIHEPRIRLRSPHWASKRDILMARSTDDHCLALAVGHHLDPLRLFTACVSLEVFQGSNVVDFDILRTSTVLTGIHQEPCFEFCPLSEYTLWLVVQGCLVVPFQ